MKTTTLFTCIALGVTTLGPLAASTTAVPAPTARAGSANAWVYRSITGQPLPRVTVVARQTNGPEGTGGTWTAITDRGGRALLGPLPPGEYEAYVVMGPKRSDPSSFAIGKGDIVASPVTVTLFFNPDID